MNLMKTTPSRLKDTLKSKFILFIRALLSLTLVWCIGGYVLVILFSLFDTPKCGFLDSVPCSRIEHILDGLGWALFWPMILRFSENIFLLPLIIYICVRCFKYSEKWISSEDSPAKLFTWLGITIALPIVFATLPFFLLSLYK